MRSLKNFRKVVLGALVGGLAVAGLAWAGEGRSTSVPIIKAPRTVQGNQKVASTPLTVEQVIINNIDHYQSSSSAAYHAIIDNPNATFSQKCQAAIDHRRLSVFRSDLGGSLGGTREYGNSVLHFTLLCPEPVATFDIPATFTVDTAPHPTELGPMSFDTDMYAIEGSATNVGVFSSVHLVGGTSNGAKSPGHTSLIPADDGSYAINSTFNVGYHLEYVGAKGGPLDGVAGSIDSNILMTAVGK